VRRLFIKAAFHQSGFSSKQLFIKAAFHQSSFSSKQLFIEAALNQSGFSSNLVKGGSFIERANMSIG
jgi:hypothetical protein